MRGTTGPHYIYQTLEYLYLLVTIALYWINVLNVYVENQNMLNNIPIFIILRDLRRSLLMC